MDKKTKFGITLAATAFLVIGGVWFISQQSSDKVCEHCGKTVVNLGMHQISCKENPADGTIVKDNELKVRNND